MAILQSKLAKGTGTALSCTLDAPPTAGNNIVAFIAYNRSSAQSISANPGGFTLRETVNSGDALLFGRNYGKIAGPGESATVSFTGSLSRPWILAVFELDNIDSADVYEDGGVHDGLTIQDQTVESGDVITAENFCLLIAMAVVQGIVPITSWDNDFTEIFQDSVDNATNSQDITAAFAFKAVNVPGTYNTVGNTGTAKTNIGVIAAYNLLSDEVPVPPVADSFRGWGIPA